MIWSTLPTPKVPWWSPQGLKKIGEVFRPFLKRSLPKGELWQKWEHSFSKLLQRFWEHRKPSSDLSSQSWTWSQTCSISKHKVPLSHDQFGNSQVNFGVGQFSSSLPSRQSSSWSHLKKRALALNFLVNFIKFCLF